ncbi:MAG: aquaporin [Armatimonadetes bacterium Cent15-Ar3]|nr:MAG: aquaporin [Armatimonadetes bacterium Cent15-Ar3]
MNKKLLAEFLGTFGIVFAPLMASAAKTDLAIAAWVSGLAVMAMIYVFGPISGAQFNPAVTIALTVSKKQERSVVVPYIVAQILGGLAAGLLGLLLFGGAFGTHVPSAPDAFVRNIGTEIVLSSILMAVIFAVIRKENPLAPVVIGLTVVLLVMMGGNITGGSMNPARSLGPDIVGGAQALGSIWVYLIGPPVGMLLAVMLERVFFTSSD